ncbi:uncharacterized protein LY89DRAFT_670245 [Mollisia scopiformis]|uniref:Uncharacterized protein n=1 Tax=Mollisia scopiformis TaxID=149040 RepID=A0A194X697_MOLSC|nr:uncharacterized protein LY89DRAFT_670245 [Mollisia scopiformis]KUJ15698.1 hypothetical protein LY89DRAFT_670245 [Mollisia scopiformis]
MCDVLYLSLSGAVLHARGGMIVGSSHPRKGTVQQSKRGNDQMEEASILPEGLLAPDRSPWDSTTSLLSFYLPYPPSQCGHRAGDAIGGVTSGLDARKLGGLCTVSRNPQRREKPLSRHIRHIHHPTWPWIEMIACVRHGIEGIQVTDTMLESAATATAAAAAAAAAL